MERSVMLRPTCRDLSHVINLDKETESNEDTEPRHCRNILLYAVFSVSYHCNFIVSSEGFTYSRIMSRCPIHTPLLSRVNVMMEGVPPR